MYGTWNFVAQFRRVLFSPLISTMMVASIFVTFLKWTSSYCSVQYLSGQVLHCKGHVHAQRTKWA
jgi:type III secretory pathway component EscT